MRLLRQIFIILLAVVGVDAAYAMPVDTTTRISLLVASPGTEIYELEGHAAMRVQGPGGDVAINWGLFSFDRPNFVYRFVKGETDYGIGAQYTSDFVYSYAAQGRGITEIPLNLTPEQVARVVALVDSTLQPGCNIYRYNYVKDNCSTRPVSIIEQAVGDTLTIAQSAQWAADTPVSFRDVMRHYHSYYPWYQFGIDLALGSGIDYAITPHEMTFAPVLLPELLATATIQGRPLTNGAVDLVGARPWPVEPTPWYLTPMCAALLILAISIALTWRDLKAGKSTKWFDSVLFGLYGLLGCVITFLVFISVHEATSPNLLLLWLNPLALIPAVAVWIKSAEKVVICYHFVNFVALLILVVAWPLLGQVGNMAFVPLIAADALRSISYVYINRCALTTAR